MKNTASSQNPETLNRLVLFAVFIGAAVPSLVLGRAVFGVITGLAILALMASALRPAIWRGLFCPVHKACARLCEGMPPPGRESGGANSIGGLALKQWWHELFLG